MPLNSMAADEPLDPPHWAHASSPLWGASSAHSFETAIAVSLPFGALAVSLLSPLAAYFLAALSIWQTGRAAKRLQWLGLIAFAHAGSVSFASRNFAGDSVDFAAYFHVYESICRGADSADGWLAFGSEAGLPLVYGGLSAIGLCGLSIQGLAYVQSLLVSSTMLGILLAICRRSVAPRDRPMVITGAALLMSFFFTTQLSRQALSSVFVLHAVFLAGTPLRRAISVLLATLFHSTGPVLIGLAWLLRKLPTRWVLVLGASLWFARSYLDGAVELAWSLSDSLSLLGKLGYYADISPDASVASDSQAVLYLLVASAPLLLAGGATSRLRDDTRMMFGFGLIALALLPLPLAATRLTLPFAFFCVGCFVFSGLNRVSRALSLTLLLMLFALRFEAMINSDSSADHGLWASFPAASVVPGYYLERFIQ